MRSFALVAALPLLLGLAQLLPHDGLGLVVRLAAASACVLLLPGAVIVLAIGRPRDLSVTVAASPIWSLGALFLSLLLTVAFGGSVTLTIVLLAGLTCAAAVPAAVRRAVEPEAGDVAGTSVVVLAGCVLAVVTWFVTGPVSGDGLFHLARVRKLLDFHLTSLRVVDEFKDGGLHPGYAFPLWHDALALIAKLAGIDPAQVVRYLSALLVPLALVVAYAAGKTLFRSAWGGAAALLPFVVQFGFPAGRTGAFRALALPATASKQLLVPAVLALTFAYLRERRSSLLAGVAVGGLALALVHPTYALFVVILLVAFLAASAILRQDGVVRIGAAAVAVLVPAGAVALWLLPVVHKTVSYHAKGGELHRALTKYGGQLDVWSNHSYRLSPSLIVQAGAVAVGALAVIPLAFFGARRRWAAFVLGTSVALFVLVLAPFVFPHVANAVSISQARRLGSFLPFAFALAGGAAVLSGLVRWAVLPVSLAAGIALQLAYPASFSYQGGGGGPGVAAWIGAVGGALALAAAVLFRGRPAFERQGPVAFLAVVLFVLPAGVDALGQLDRAHAAPVLTPGIVEALRERVPPKAVVFSDDATSYEVAASAPVYVNAAPPSHVANTTQNRPFRRRDDALRFMRTGKLRIPRRYGARWIVVDRSRYSLRLRLPVVYQDRRYTLYRLAAA